MSGNSHVPALRPGRFDRAHESPSDPIVAPVRLGDRVRHAVSNNRDVLSNSASLVTTTIVTSLVGFVFWWVAARMYSVEAVGQASAAIAALTLLSTVGMFGLGTLLVGEIPRRTHLAAHLTTAALLASGFAAALLGVGYVTFCLVIGGDLGAFFSSPWIIAGFVMGVGLSAAVLVLDQGLIGLLMGSLQTWRNLYMSIGKLVLLIAGGVLIANATGSAIFACWLAGIVLSLMLLTLHLRRRGMRLVARPAIRELRGLSGQTFDHNLLNIALLIPRFCLPIIVTAVLGAADNAAFYAAFMLVSFVYLIPVPLGLVLFAVATGDRVELRNRLRFTLAISAGVGIPAALVLIAGASLFLKLFGPGYADTATTCLQILAIAYAPWIIKTFYVTVARVHNRLRIAALWMILGGSLELIGSIVGAQRGGLAGLAIGLAIVTAIEGAATLPTVARAAGFFRAARPELASS